MANVNRATILCGVGTPSSRSALKRFLPATYTVEQAVNHIRRQPPKDEREQEALASLEAELGANRWSYLAVRETGPEPVNGDTYLPAIAVVREVRTPAGIEKVIVAALQVVAYAPVAAGR